MVALIVVGSFVFIVGLGAWLRASVDRRTRRSMHQYESALDRLGDLSRRVDARAHVQVPYLDGVAAPHVDLEPSANVDGSDAGKDRPPDTIAIPRISAKEFGTVPVFDDLEHIDKGVPATTIGAETAAALARLVARARGNGPHKREPVTAPPERPAARLARSGVLRFDDVVPDTDETRTVTALHAVADRASKASSKRALLARSASDLRGPLTLAAGVVIVAALTAFLVTRPAAKPNATAPTPTTARPASTTTTSTTTPTSLHPVQVSKSLVVYDVPKHSYTVRLAASGVAWFGIQHRVNGPYMAMDTLQSGGTASYQESGETVIRLGAPRVSSITVDQIPVVLPAGFVIPYDVELNVAPQRHAS